MISVRIDAETPEEVAALLRDLAARCCKSDINGTVGEYGEALLELIQDGVALHLYSGAVNADLRSKARMDYRSAREKLDEIRASEATRDSDVVRRDTPA